MTYNQPLQPFTVKSSLLSDPRSNASDASNSGWQVPGAQNGALNDFTPHGAGGSAGGGSGPRGPQEPPNDAGGWQIPEGFLGRMIQWTAALGFVALYSASQRYAEAAPLEILVLVACVMLRLNRRERQVAAVPAVVAGTRLVLEMATTFARLPFLQAAGRAMAPANAAVNWNPQAFGVTWVPLFCASCLFYMPKRTAVTAKIILVCSVVLLVTGLLPSEGYLYIFAMVQMALFVAVGIGLIFDFVPQPSNAATRQAVWGARP